MFNVILPFCFWSQYAIPGVFSEALTSQEVLARTAEKMNEIIENLNEVPELIDKKIEEAFDQEGIANKIKEILADYTLMATNPPNNMAPMVGDGITDNTSALNSLITYASANNKMLIIPDGVYQVSGCTLAEGVAIVGYTNTILKLKEVANVPILSGTVTNAVIDNISFDGNNTKQTIKSPAVKLSGNLYMHNCTFDDCYNAIECTTAIASFINIKTAQDTAVILDGDSSMITGLNIGNCNKAIIINGVDNYVSGNVQTRATISIVPEQNTLILQNKSVDLYLSDNLKINTSEVLLSADTNIVQTAAKISTTADNSTTTISGDSVITSGNYNNTADNHMFDAHDTFDIMSKNANVTASNATMVEGNIVTVTGTDNITLTTDKLTVDSQNPMVYNTPKYLSDNYNYVPFTDVNGNNYQVLVYNGTEPGGGGGGESHKPVYANVKDYGAVGDGTTDDSDAFISAANIGGYIYVPSGNYKIGKSITLPSTCYGMIGEGQASKISVDNTFHITFVNATLNSVTFLNNGSTTPVILASSLGVNQSWLNVPISVAGGYSYLSKSTFTQNIVISNGNVVFDGNNFDEIEITTTSATLMFTSNVFVAFGGFTINPSDKKPSLLMVNNAMTPQLTIDETIWESVRTRNNINIDNIPPESTPVDPFDFNVPINQPLTFKGNVDKQFVNVTGDIFGLKNGDRYVWSVNPQGQYEQYVNSTKVQNITDTYLAPAGQKNITFDYLDTFNVKLDGTKVMSIDGITGDVTFGKNVTSPNWPVVPKIPTSAFANVKDYGAKGDGTTDDTQAFKTALSSGFNVFVPVGNYKITAPLDIVNCLIVGCSTSSILNFSGTARFNIANVGISNLQINSSASGLGAVYTTSGSNYLDNVILNGNTNGLVHNGGTMHVDGCSISTTNASGYTIFVDKPFTMTNCIVTSASSCFQKLTSDYTSIIGNAFVGTGQLLNNQAVNPSIVFANNYVIVATKTFPAGIKATGNIGVPDYPPAPTGESKMTMVTYQEITVLANVDVDIDFDALGIPSRSLVCIIFNPQYQWSTSGGLWYYNDYSVIKQEGTRIPYHFWCICQDTFISSQRNQHGVYLTGLGSMKLTYMVSYIPF